jgi:predicted aspartyl protease
MLKEPYPVPPGNKRPPSSWWTTELSTVLPAETWKAIELAPKRRLTFVLADGTQIERDVSEAYISLPLGDGHTPVVLGEEGDQALLGVVTLEELGLVFNPFQRSLQPARMMMA